MEDVERNKEEEVRGGGLNRGRGAQDCDLALVKSPARPHRLGDPSAVMRALPGG